MAPACVDGAQARTRGGGTACAHPRVAIAPRAHDVVQRLAVDELHREIGPPDPGIDGEDVVAHDRVVRQMVEDRGFLAEQRQDRLVAGEFRQDDLDRDVVAGLDVVAAIDLAHAAGRDAFVEFVDAAELRADAGVRQVRAIFASCRRAAHRPRLPALDRHPSHCPSVSDLDQHDGDVVGAAALEHHCQQLLAGRLRCCRAPRLPRSRHR